MVIKSSIESEKKGEILNWILWQEPGSAFSKKIETIPVCISDINH